MTKSVQVDEDAMPYLHQLVEESEEIHIEVGNGPMEDYRLVESRNP